MLNFIIKNFNTISEIFVIVSGVATVLFYQNHQIWKMFDKIDQRFQKIDEKFDRLEQRIDQMGQRIDKAYEIMMKFITQEKK